MERQAMTQLREGAFRLLPRYTEHAPIHDPLEIAIAQRAARETQARAEIAAGRAPDADPQDLRGIPVIARGVGGASPHTSPHMIDYDR